MRMERLTSHRFVPAIVAGQALVPERIAERLHYHIFTGADPIWAGLHSFEDASYGRSYRSMMHAVYPYHQRSVTRSKRVPTLVMPEPETPDRIVHEIGHFLDEVLGFAHGAAPVSSYAATERSEAFAEAFTAWVVPGYSSERVDGATARLLRDLSGVA